MSQLPLFQLPLGVPRSPRLVPDSGTNMSSVFGIDCLAALGCSEEQLEALAYLRAQPLRTLEMVEHKQITVGEIAKTNLTSGASTHALIELRSMMQQNSITDLQLGRMVRIAISEKRAAGNVVALRSFCKGLRARYSTLGQDKLQELASAVGRARRVLMLDGSALVNAIGSVLLSVQPAPVGKLVAEASAYATALGVRLLPKTTPEIETAMQQELAVLGERRTFIDNAALSGAPLLGRLLPPPTDNYTAEHALLDCELLEYLLSVKKHGRFLDEIYYRMAKISSNFMLSTPAELMLPRVVSACLERVMYSVVLGQLSLAFLASYDRVGRVHWLDAAHENTSLFRSATQIGELMGADARPVHATMLELCEALFPSLTSDTAQPSADELVALSAKAMETPGSRCWQYEQRLPWMPLAARPSGNVAGALGLLRADTPLCMLGGDQWLHLRWAGFTGEPGRRVIDNGKLVRTHEWRSRLPEAVLASLEKTFESDGELAQDIRERIETLQRSLDGLPLYFDTRPRVEKEVVEDDNDAWLNWGE